MGGLAKFKEVTGSLLKLRKMSPSFSDFLFGLETWVLSLADVSTRLESEGLGEGSRV